MRILAALFRFGLCGCFLHPYLYIYIMYRGGGIGMISGRRWQAVAGECVESHIFAMMFYEINLYGNDFRAFD
jgi:hypothetical protein